MFGKYTANLKKLFPLIVSLMNIAKIIGTTNPMTNDHPMYLNVLANAALKLTSLNTSI